MWPMLCSLPSYCKSGKREINAKKDMFLDCFLKKDTVVAKTNPLRLKAVTDRL